MTDIKRCLPARLLLASLAVLLALINAVPGAQGAEPSPCPRLPILAYHHVTPELPAGTPENMARYYVSVDQFEKQLQALQAYGYQAIGIDDLLAYRQGLATLPPCPVILTFDDGAQDHYQFVYPLLQQYGMTATFFIPTGKIADTAEDRRPNTLAGGPGSYHMIWPEVLELAAQGFSIGSHTVTHANLKDLASGKRQYELEHSLNQIQNKIGPQPANILAFPYGEGFGDLELAAAVEEAGYQAALGYGGAADKVIDLKALDPLGMPRRTILRDVSLELDNKDPWWFFMRRVDPDFPLPDLSLKSFAPRGPGGELFPVVRPGERLELEFQLSNWGSELSGLAQLVVRDGAGQEVFEFEQSVLLPARSGSIPLKFSWVLPQLAGEGPYTAELSVLDASGLLSYFSSGILRLDPSQLFLPILSKFG